jgi:hypothetical protein
VVKKRTAISNLLSRKAPKMSSGSEASQSSPRKAAKGLTKMIAAMVGDLVAFREANRELNKARHRMNTIARLRRNWQKNWRTLDKIDRGEPLGQRSFMTTSQNGEAENLLITESYVQISLYQSKTLNPHPTQPLHVEDAEGRRYLATKPLFHLWPVRWRRWPSSCLWWTWRYWCRRRSRL